MTRKRTVDVVHKGADLLCDGTRLGRPGGHLYRVDGGAVLALAITAMQGQTTDEAPTKPLMENDLR